MFRFSLIVCVSLIFGITAKPYKSLNKFTDEVFQDTIMSLDDRGKMSWRVEMEPPEDMDKTLYDIDMYHPSVADLKVQIQTQDTLHAADIQAELPKEDMKYNQEPEEDRDDIYHHVFIEVASKESEQGWDEVYDKEGEDLHPHDNQRPPLKMELLRRNVRVHLQPEENLDSLYHKDDPQLVLYQDDAKADAPAYLPSQMKYSEPEEDLDGLYHQ